jgi:ribosome-binding factor A
LSARHGHLLSELQRKVQTLIARGLNDPRIRGLVSVTGVELSSDLAELKVKISVLPAEHASLSMEGLHSATGKIQRQLASSLRMRRAPRLRFELDDSLKRQAALYAAISRDSPSAAPDGSPTSSTEESPPP